MRCAHGPYRFRGPGAPSCRSLRGEHDLARRRRSHFAQVEIHSAGDISRKNILVREQQFFSLQKIICSRVYESCCVLLSQEAVLLGIPSGDGDKCVYEPLPVVKLINLRVI